MNCRIQIPVLITVLMFFIISCNKGPHAEGPSSEYQKIEEKSGSGLIDPQNPSNVQSNETLSNELHTVVVKEILPASRYLYLNVEEGSDQFWIAVRKMEIDLGGVYYYKRALLKTNFESKENNKVFDKIYLVSNLVGANHAKEQKSMDNIKTEKEVVAQGKRSVKNDAEPVEEINIEGSLKIADLVKNFRKYEGETVQISGTCVKINPGIMNRNWIHIKDGSRNDYDLVITSETYVAEGSVVTMKAKVSLNKDFGAGYKYDLILEDGVLVK